MATVYERRGGEIVVNTTTQDHQDWAQIVYLTDGRFVIVWRDRSGVGADPLGHSIRGQIYNADGTPSGGEFLVNTTLAGSQTQPAMFALPTGGFVVAWTDINTSNDSNIRAQVFDAAGSKAGGEIAVNSHVPGAQTLAGGTALADGTFVLTWTDSTAEPTVPNTGDSPIGVRMQRFDAAGAPLGVETQVNTTAVYEQSMSRVAALPGGGYVIVWRDLGTKSGIVGQMFNADGTKSGAEFMVSTVVTNTQSTPSIATLAGGGFIVTWTDGSHIGGDTSYTAIKGQLFDSAGAKVGSEFLVNTNTSGYQDSSFVSALPDGGFVAVWTTTTETATGDGNGAAARGQFFDANGAKVGAEFLVNVAIVGDQYAAGVGVGPNGLTFVTIDAGASSGDGSGAAVKLSHFIVAPGTEAADTLSGTQFADTVNGFGGDDVLSGLAGDDQLKGGDGVDQLFGNEGADFLDGGAGNDALDGGIGADLLAGAGGDDLLDGGDGADTLLGEAGSDTLLGGADNDLLDGGTGLDTLDGGAGDDQLYVNADGPGEEKADGGTGVDTLFFSLPANGAAGLTYSRTANPAGGFNGWISDGAGYLLTFTGIERFNLSGSGANDELAGGDLDDILIGAGGNDILRGFGGADQIIGGAGIDTLIGGAGDDTYLDHEAGDTVIEEANGGIDQIRTTALNYTLPDNVEWLRGMASVAQQLTGNTLDNTLIGTNYNDILDGGAGADRMFGGYGNDIYYIDNIADTISEDLFGDGGIDEIRTSLAVFSLTSVYNVENLTGVLATGQTLTGNEFNNTIRGGAGNDTIDGGAGFDRMEGGAGNDTYLVDQPNDVIVELAGGGTDEVVLSSGWFVLPDHVENGRIAVGGSGSITGNALDNILRGTDSTDHLNGGAGADTLIGGKGWDYYTVDNVGDVIVEEEDTAPWADMEGYGDHVTTSLADYTLRWDLERLEGTSVQQRLVGNDKANYIGSGGGNDTLIGGKGNDHYSIYAGDIIIELEGEGIDTVSVSGGNYTLGDTLERLSGQSSSGQILTGNRFNNYISASSGNDTLDGAGGADTMEGGSGNDIYYVDDAGDTVFERANGGTDEVRTALAAYVLPAEVERFTGLSASGQSVTGNTLSNTVTGAGGNDIFFLYQGGSDLVRRGGTDIVSGGDGDDLVHFGNTLTAADQIDGGAGNDTLTLQGANINLTLSATTIRFVEKIVFLSHADTSLGLEAAAAFNYRMVTNDQTVSAGGLLTIDASGLDAGEALIFDGSAELNGRFAMTGGAGADNLRGGAGNDLLDGGAGIDRLTGGLGNDIYVLDDLGDVVVEGAGEGIDEVRTSIGSRYDYTALYTLAPNVENFTGTSSAGQGVFGNALNNVFKMGAGDDLLVVWEGGDDAVFGGAGGDFLFYGGAFTNADSTDGGTGYDIVALLGNYTVTFDADDLVGIEHLVGYSSGNPANPYSYNFTMIDANLAAGRNMMVEGLSLTASETFVFNGSAEKDGSFNARGGLANDTITGGGGNDQIYGNFGADVLKGGGGRDLFEYYAAGESTAAAPDTILDFTKGDWINLWNIDADGNAANGNSAFRWIGSGGFTHSAGQVRAYQDGTDALKWIVEADINGDGAADLTIHVFTQPGFVWSASDFVL
ncbi:MAG TPA: calcium-binding protein [Allosphingosinicella sp.]|jgi:Ca2+-binding RTX toxin-like protein